MRVLIALVIAVFAGPAWTDGARLGKVHFKVECNEAAQAEFNVAMAYYHSFAWAQMREPLERMLKADASCGMAHWARVLASLNNPFAWPTVISAATLAEGPRLLEEAERTGLKSQRERDYVHALAAFFEEQDKRDHKARAQALEKEFEQLMRRYPRDEEAATLYALILSANFDPTDKKYTNQLKAAKILEKVFLDQPDHPGAAHYLIHSYDYPPIAKRGLNAAHRYSKIAPDAPHALHMPSHVFTRVGAWRESIESTRASARAGGDKSFDRWHAYDYMVYAHLQLGEREAARQVVEEALQDPARVDHPATAYAYAAMPARLALERGAWKEAAGLELVSDFPWKKYTLAEAVMASARGIGAAMSGDTAAARAEAERLEKLRAATALAYWQEQLAIEGEVVKGLALLAEGDAKQALAALRAAAKREDATEKHVVTPGPLVPAREVLAYALLERGEAKAALREFEAVLAKEPGRLRALAGAGQAAERSGNRRKAKEYAAKLPAP
ncbi:MAG: tetratricopeptide repeat protein [Betaproteobacteria bacterium]